MSRKLFSLFALPMLASALGAQDPAAGRCATPDSIAVRGNRRVDAATVLSDAGLVQGTQLSFRLLQDAIRQLYATGQFDRVELNCSGTPAGDYAILYVDVRERPILDSLEVRGVTRLSERAIRDQADLPLARPLDASAVAQALYSIDSTYEAHGDYLATVRADTTVLEGGGVRVTFEVEEGGRLAIAGIRIEGNEHISDAEIVGAMATKPEGFFWWRRGEFRDETFAQDLAERIPRLYAQRGFIDFRVARDTLIVDEALGKAVLEIHVVEGPQYQVGDFDVVGSRHFSSGEISEYYPFTEQPRPLAQRVTDFLRRRTPVPQDIFNLPAWEDATAGVRQAYANDGYIYASVRPVTERRVGPDSTHYVDLRWEIEEGTPAIVNRVEIVGNDFTTETCIRDQLVILPGDVFDQQRLLQSWQSIGNLGFFEMPLPVPEYKQANDQGDVDIVFRVKEKRTGNLNFGASMGQGTGFGGFISLDQPNLFGQCKRGALQWQFGRYFNDFSITYSDPRIRKSMISGTVTLYRTMARYYIADLGRSLRTGGSLQLGFPVPWDVYSRFFVSYAGEGVRFGDNGLLGQTAQLYGDAFRSTLGISYGRDTRVGTPFPTSGTSQTVSASFTGGPLGGRSAFQRYTTEASAYVPLAEIGDRGPQTQPMVLVAGLTSRAGAVFGNTGPFFFSQEFALGGVQYGERLRGYDEFSISPEGYVVGTSTFNAQRGSFGKAFFSTTAELGLRINQALYANVFYDAGNVWRRAREINPTRLFRGVGIGVSMVTPFGPLGLDYALGLDRLDPSGRRDPKWQLHFRFGQLF